MDAAEERRLLGVKAQCMIDGSGSAGERRALALARAMGGRTGSAAISFHDVATAPGWLARDRDAQRDFARRVGLCSMAEHLAGSIDGEWLAGLARVAGDDALDSAVARAGTGMACGMPPVDAAGLERRGFALMETVLDGPLRPLLAWADADRDMECTREDAGACVAMAQDRAA